MKSRTLIAAVGLLVVVVLVLFAVWMRRGGAVALNNIDLVELFPEAEKRTTVPSLEQAFAITSVTVDGTERRAIYAHPTSRIIWPVTVPPNGVLRTSFGLRPDAWDEDGDGVQFRIGVSDGRTYDELLRQYVNPHGRQADRRWYTVTLDLAAYEGRSVHVIFNTDPGPPGGWNTVHDFACWGEPHIYSAR